jgi:tRNA(Ile2)-agmatinylcytidine synthase
LKVEFHIGIDDTDSPRGGCTTYTMSLLSENLQCNGLEIDGYPCLVRLNPNVPWKTRGNAATSLHLNIPENKIGEVKEAAIRTVKETSDISQPNTDPAIAFLKGPVPSSLREFYSRALTDVLTVDEATNLTKEAGVDSCLLKGNRGLIGALAAVGADLDRDDHTFEIIAYRTKENRGTKRNVDPESVREMNSRMADLTFNNLDPETGRILVAPHGPDPVLFGVRGEDPSSLIEAFEMVRPNEPIERATLFKTNQGTDAHLFRSRMVRDLQEDQAGNVMGEVVTNPMSSIGGHVFFRLSDDSGEVDCAAYEPTGQFRTEVLSLVPGDRIIAFGGVRSNALRALTFNLEKFEVVHLVSPIEQRNRSCEKCGGCLESMGKGQGGRCRKCGHKVSGPLKYAVQRQRQLQPGLHIPPPRALRHLTRPRARHGTEIRIGQAVVTSLDRNRVFKG